MQFLFKLSSLIYSLILTQYENFFLKKYKTHNDLEINGFFVLKNSINEVSFLKNFKKTSTNKYLNKILFSDENINLLLNDIFIKNKIADKISKLTGFSYSIDYILAYETLPISEEDMSKGWYANHFHKDKPFSKNTLKIIIPLETINIENGPMEIIDLKNSKKLNNENLQNNNFKFTGSKEDLFLFKPNLCFHRAGIPKKNYLRKQLMMQLNPSNKWTFNKSLYIYQSRREPKFPLFAYLFDKKIILN